MRAFLTYVECFLKATFSQGFSHTLIARLQMPKGDFRAQLPALANKTYFNEAALPKASHQTPCGKVVLRRWNQKH